jgi:hypothetical protein
MMNRLVALLVLALISSQFAPAQPIPAQYKAGPMHGFLLVKSPQGKLIAVGDLVQMVEGAQVHSRLLFRFRDGSTDDESTVFLQKDVLQLVSDHHVQKGPSFPAPLNVTIDVPAAEVTWHEAKGGKIEVHKDHMELPNDLANGIIPAVMENLSQDAAETKVSYLANTPKPRIVTISVKPDGRERFTVGGLAYFANRYVMHVELGGFAGLIAPIIGKQPPDSRGWIVPGEVPSFARLEGAFYPSGPVWTVELSSPVWSSDVESR